MRRRKNKEMINNILNFLNTNTAGLIISGSIIAGAFKFWQFVDIGNKDERQRDFNNYHNLIKRLLVDEKSGNPFIDVQIASVYELRNFSRYYYVTKIILNRLKNRIEKEDSQKELIDEIEKTIEFIKKKK